MLPYSLAMPTDQTHIRGIHGHTVSNSKLSKLEKQGELGFHIPDEFIRPRQKIEIVKYSLVVFYALLHTSHAY